MNQEYVVLVDENDVQQGLMEKMEAHEKALLHRAFSVFVFNDEGKMLLQQRALSKYHSGGLWTNTCCSHPRDGETPEQAGERRLQEEMGFSCSLKKAFAFTYIAPFDNGLTEHEYDHVLIGEYNDNPEVNPDEVESYKWVTWNELLSDVEQHPEEYTEWFKIALDQVLDHMNDFGKYKMIDKDGDR